MPNHTADAVVIGAVVIGAGVIGCAGSRLDERLLGDHPINAIICEETLRLGGSIVHHHGVGKHRTAWIEAEHGSAWPMLARLKQAFDPNGIMNAGTIWPRPLG